MITQNQDDNTSPAMYNILYYNQLLVTSIFSTIQGEGPFVGKPAIFLRLAGCNRGRKQGMGCSFCDTNFKLSEGKIMTFSQILEKIRSLPLASLLVITGGEPFLQKNIVRFLATVLETWTWLSHVQIESNGDCGPEELKYLSQVIDDSSIEFKVVVSPKAEKSFTPFHKNLATLPLSFKFLISGDPESPYYDTPPLSYWSKGVKAPEIYLSPLTSYHRSVLPGEIASAWSPGLINVEETERNYARAVELCFRHGFRLSLQTHLFLGVE